MVYGDYHTGTLADCCGGGVLGFTGVVVDGAGDFILVVEILGSIQSLEGGVGGKGGKG